MVLRPEPVAAALAELRRPESIVILLDPAGEVFRQATRPGAGGRRRTSCSCVPATRASTNGSASMVDRELSIGDYVLTGGELAALVVVDAVLRLLPGAIDEASTAEESFAAGLLEYPAVHAPGDVRRRVGPAGPGLRPPRGGPPLAAPGVAAPHARAAAGPARRARAVAGRGRRWTRCATSAASGPADRVPAPAGDEPADA